MCEKVLSRLTDMNAVCHLSSSNRLQGVRPRYSLRVRYASNSRKNVIIFMGRHLILKNISLVKIFLNWCDTPTFYHLD